MCAMIRINYGTPWAGDEEILKNFFPNWFHKSLSFGGLSPLIEALSPFTDEPTEHGVDNTMGSNPQKISHQQEVTASISLFTTDIPL